MTQPQPVRSPWTEDGCLMTVPAREAANDNVVLDQVTFTDSGGGVAMPGAFAGRRFSMLPHEPYRSFDHLPPVIALSGAAGSGKSTVSDFLAVRFGYTKTKFAKPLKDMCRALGLDECHIEGDLKETPQDWLGGKTPRHAMQTLGTDWGRNCMGEDFWVDMWSHSIRGRCVIVDDCRFANEAARVRKMGGRVIRIVGRGGIAGGHASEVADFIADAVVENTGTIAELQARVLEVIEGWRAEADYGDSRHR